MKFICISFAGKYYDSLRSRYNQYTHFTSPTQNFYLDSFIILIDRIINDSTIGIVVINYKDNFTIKSFTQLEEIADQLSRIIDSGKEIYFYADNYNLYSLYLSSMCTRSFIHKAGMLHVKGFSITKYYLKDLLKKYNLDFEVIASGEDKTLFDPFLQDDMKESQKEVYKNIIDLYYNKFIDFLSVKKNKPAEKIKGLFNRKILTSDELVDEKWIDQAEIFDKLIDGLLKLYKVKKISSKVLRQNCIGKSKNKIAILFVDGMISEAKLKKKLSLVNSVQSEMVINNLKRVRNDNDIRGVILRLNSSGGSVIAVQNILYELELLRSKKHIVISIGSTAASAAYWISVKGNYIFANPTSITGSIGVISGKIVLGPCLNDLGIKYCSVTDHYSSGPLLLRKYSPEETENLQKHLDRLKDMFIRDIIENRRISEEDISKIGSGRVLSSIEALKLGLIDKTGSLNTAINYLMEVIGNKSCSIELLPKIKSSFMAELITLKWKKIFASASFSSAAIITGLLSCLSEQLFNAQCNAVSIPAYFTDSEIEYYLNELDLFDFYKYIFPTGEGGKWT